MRRGCDDEHGRGARLTWVIISSLVVSGMVGSVFAQDAETATKPRIELRQADDKIDVMLDGKLFTRYHAKSGAKPILWPVIGPGEVQVTRGYPMREASADEASDHPHHRSLWFTHGNVNGVNFWNEPKKGGSKRGFGEILHREFLPVEDGDSPKIKTRNEWVDAKGEKILTDYRTLGFGASASRRWIDFDVQLVADVEDKPVKFGDTKEGTFGIRVAGWMKVDDQSGHIINNLNNEDKDAWGKAASWVDYHGEKDGRKLGVAILNHPSSFRFPTYWHVRTYGLFAANVFGLHNFKNSDEEDGSHELQPGESVTFCYRVLLHEGDEQIGRVPESFIEYAKVEKSGALNEDLKKAIEAAGEAEAEAEDEKEAESEKEEKESADEK